MWLNQVQFYTYFKEVMIGEDPQEICEIQIKNQTLKMFHSDHQTLDLHFILQNASPDFRKYSGKFTFTKIPSKFKGKQDLIERLKHWKASKIQIQYVDSETITLNLIKNICCVELKLQKQINPARQHKLEKQDQLPINEIQTYFDSQPSEDEEEYQKSQELKQKRINKELHEFHDEYNPKGPLLKYNSIYPYKSVVKIKSTLQIKGDKPYITHGSGCLISPFLVLTCAHNVFSYQKRAYFGKIQVKASGFLPATVLSYRINKEYVKRILEQEQESEYDYAVLFLDAPFNLPSLKMLSEFNEFAFAEIPGYPLKTISRSFKCSVSFIISCKIGNHLIKDAFIKIQNLSGEIPKVSMSVIQFQFKTGTLSFKENDEWYECQLKGILCLDVGCDIFENGKSFSGRINALAQGHATGGFQARFDHGQFLGRLVFKSKKKEERYPEDYEYNSNEYNLENARNKIEAYEKHIIRHKISSTKGQSGSPLFVELEIGKFYIIGIHIANDIQNRQNLAVRLSSQVTHMIRKFCAELLAQCKKRIQIYLTPTIQKNMVIDITEYACIRDKVIEQRGFSLIEPEVELFILAQEAKTYQSQEKLEKAAKNYKKADKFWEGYKNHTIVNQLMNGTSNYISICLARQLRYKQWLQNRKSKGKISKQVQETLFRQCKTQLQKNLQDCEKVAHFQELHLLKLQIMKRIVQFDQEGNKYGKHKTFEALLDKIDSTNSMTLLKYNLTEKQKVEAESQFNKLRYNCHVRLGQAFADENKRKMFPAFHQYLKAEDVLYRCIPPQNFVEIYRLIFMLCIYQSDKIDNKLEESSAFKIGVDYAYKLLLACVDDGRKSLHQEIMKQFTAGMVHICKFTKNPQEIAYALDKVRKINQDPKVINKPPRNLIDLLERSIRI